MTTHSFNLDLARINMSKKLSVTTQVFYLSEIVKNIMEKIYIPISQGEHLEDILDDYFPQDDPEKELYYDRTVFIPDDIDMNDPARVAFAFLVDKLDGPLPEYYFDKMFRVEAVTDDEYIIAINVSGYQGDSKIAYNVDSQNVVLDGDIVNWMIL